MRISRPRKRFFRIGLFAVIAIASYWVCSHPTESATVASQTATRPPMYVLQVGIGKYQHTPTWAELRGAVTDVVEMRKVLESDRWKIPPANIVTLMDAEGTKQNIFEKFQTHLIANAEKQFQKTNNRREGAVILFQFSGHGSQVQDQDGDEKDDGKDETLVTVDSDDAPGKNFDITDDEIYALTSRLRAYTDNIVYIFDSCHSGSGTRDGQDVRRLPERKNPVVPIPGIIPPTRSGGVVKPQDTAGGVLPPGDDYIVITAARANELASQRNCFEECGQTERPVVYGYLTYYLVDELKNARSDTSYRELMENVARRVSAEKPSQSPQLEGDKSRFVFGALGRTEDNYVRIIEGETKKPNGDRMVKIAAGAMQGVTVGTIISFYDKAVTRFDQVERISSGSVTAVLPGESTVKLLEPARTIMPTDKSVVLSPDFGSLRLKVDLDVDAAKLTASEKAFVSSVRSLLVPSDPDARREVDLVATKATQAARWDVALLKDKFSNVSAKSNRAMGDSFTCLAPTLEDNNARGPAGGPDRDVYYLAAQDFVPLFGFCMETATADERVSAERLRKAIAHIAGIKIVNSISNKRSRLAREVSVTPVFLKGDITCNQSVLVASDATNVKADPQTGFYLSAPRQPIWFEIENRSTKPLYIAMLNIDPNGAVTLFAPRKRLESSSIGGPKGVLIPPGGKRILPGDDCRTENGGIVEAGALRTSRMAGLDRFKFIFSTSLIVRDDFAYLEQPPISGADRKGSATLGSADWTTVETILQITDTRK